MTDTKYTATKSTTERAIVIGGGISGLLAAKVLSEYYGEILVIDRDALPDLPENRPGTPQAFQPHRLSPRGSLILNRLFPGLTEELLTNGAPSSQGRASYLINPYGNMVTVNPQQEALFSRALLEWALRRRVQMIPHVHFLARTDVLGFYPTPDRSQIIGVQIQERGSAQAQVNPITSDLVIDCSGRSSKAVQWLTELGYDVPEPELLRVSLGYSTRHYKIPSDKADQWNVLRSEGDPARGTYTAVLSVIENNIAEMTLWGLGGRYPATNAEQFEREVAQLANPIFMERLQELEPVSSPRGYRVPELTRQHFEQMRRWPSGLLVMGDAFAQFDPIYGQGMTVAAIEAEILAACLSQQQLRPRSDFELSVLQRMQDTIEPAWWLNGVADLRWPGVEHVGPEPLKGLTFAQRYFEFILRHSTEQTDYQLHGLYWLVNSLYLSPSELFNPHLVSSLLADGSDAGKQLLYELAAGSDRSIEELLEHNMPSFERAAFATMDQLMQQP
ncbi:FAD-dependent oxidoreductase [Paenibacillus kobensis]|uniref:FAD-dependent oxidoreductase n=1 Tax=Paenibacillus kobensis TaxID=59841 RepID=UPI000FDBE9AA|nr:FAD-dependent monooxygenase [Paenibacillus kobensis]